MVGWSVSQDKSGQAFGEVDRRCCINTSEDQKQKTELGAVRLGSRDSTRHSLIYVPFELCPSHAAHTLLIFNE